MSASSDGKIRAWTPRFGKFIAAALLLSFCAACQSAATAENERDKAKAERQSRNEAALARARGNVEKYRKGDARIKVLDTRGRPLRGVHLNVKQISHDFKFGCYLKIDDLAPEKLPEYEKHFARLFNYAVVGTYWDFIENKKGDEDWSWFEREIALARKLGARVGAAPILWGTNPAGTPAWLPRRRSELRPLLERRVRTAIAKYETSVDDWEIVNEPLAPKPDFFAASLGGEYVAEAFSQARAAGQKERLMINEYGVFGSVAAHNYNREKYFSLLKSLIEKGAPVDIIGIQAHAVGEWFEPSNVAEQLDRYAALGKPIQISEFSAQTFEYDNRAARLEIAGTYRTGDWDDEKQAEFYREFYTVAFGNPQVEAIVSWGLDDERAWLPGIGLIDAAGRTKPNYRMLDRLINDEWRTNLRLDLTESGGETVGFRGFFGVYEIEAFAADGGGHQRRTSARFELKKDRPNEWILRFEKEK